jgi:hypothetical protein
MSDRNKCAGLEIETSHDNTDLHIFPRETRRGKAQWAIWVHADGSGILFAGNEQIVLSKNGPDKVKGLSLKRNSEGQLEFLLGSDKVLCHDSACPLLGPCQHEFGKGCRLYKE